MKHHAKRKLSFIVIKYSIIMGPAPEAQSMRCSNVHA